MADCNGHMSKTYNLCERHVQIKQKMKEITPSKVALVCSKCSLQLETNQTLNPGCSTGGAWLSKSFVKSLLTLQSSFPVCGAFKI